MGDKIGQVKINRQSMDSFTKLLNETSKVYNGQLPTVIKFGARDLLFSLIAVTPIARNNGRMKGRGYAKTGWGVAMVGLGVMPRSPIFAPNSGRSATWPQFGSFVNNLKRKNTPSVTMTNAVPYIEEMNGSSTIIPLASQHAALKIEKRLSDHSKRFAKRWK